MLTQAIPVEGSSRPFVYTGHGKEIFNQTALNQETPVDGKVTVITDEFMRIDRSDGGSPVIIKKPDTYNTANHTSNFFTPCVSVGDKVRAGQTVYSCSSFKNKELALGVPLLTAFTSFYAREHEDGMVLSESAAKKFGAKMMCKVQIPLMKQDEWFLGHNVFDELPEVDSSKFDDLGLIKLGSEVRRGDPIFACWARLDPRRSEIARLQLALDKNAIPKAIYMAKVPHKVPDGTVTRIYFNPVRGYQSNGSMTRQDFMKLATHFGAENRSFRSREAQQLGIDIRQLKDYMVKPTNFSNEEQLGEIVIEITYINPLKVSDKMANGFGGKGVVAEIVPDDKMLRTKDGQVIDIIMSPLAVISRINLSQLYVSNLGLISSNLYIRIGNYLNAGGENSDEPKWQKEGELLKECLRLVSPDNPKRTLRQAYDDAEGGFIRIKATAMDRYFTAELITDLLKKLNIEDHEQLFDPIQYKWIRTPIRVGYQEFYRLHFIAEEKMKATGSIKSLGIEGYGAVRKKGQSLGEQEAHALLAWGEGDLLRKFSYEKQDKSSRFFQEMLSIGLLLHDERDKDTATMEKGVEPEV